MERKKRLGGCCLNKAAYDILALTLRYWFVFLVGYILYRTIENAYLEYKYEKRVRRDVPDEEYVGYLRITAAAQGEEDHLFGTWFGLREDNLIGRSKKCDIVIPNPTISSSHARIYKKGKKVWISDLGSRNGTFVNRKKINEDNELRSGDEIQMGNLFFSVSLNE